MLHVGAWTTPFHSIPFHSQNVTLAISTFADCFFSSFLFFLPLLFCADIQKEATLHLVLRLRGGGKVHGSLARAGKVKGQTPKVAAQDKKKRLTGRAKKREQYNRRFVNVASNGMGKKVGPNNNAARVEREEAQAANKKE